MKCNALKKPKILPWVSVPSLYRHGPENRGPFLSGRKRDIKKDIKKKTNKML